MEKQIILFTTPEDDYDQAEQLWDPENREMIYYIYDLCDSPEDAIIGRDLPSSRTAIDLLELGMKYSKEGYDSIKVIPVEIPYDEDWDKFIKEYLNKIN